MMIAAIAGLYLPAVFAASIPGARAPVVEQLSELVAVVLLIVYLAYLFYTLQHEEREPGEPRMPAPEPGRKLWSKRRSLIVLGGATVGAATVMEIVPLLPSLVAVTVAVPAPTAVTCPLGATVSADGLVLDHVTVRPDSWLPCASRSVTVSACA